MKIEEEDGANESYITLLGKLVWQLVMETEGFWARLMQAKYYPNGDVLSADLGSYLSYTWRGIMEARDALGCGWRRHIGDGLLTRVWYDAWLPATQTGRILSPWVAGQEDLMVADLLEEHGEGWRNDHLNSLFLPFKGERIRSIRISLCRPRDVWYWVAVKDGVLTVRSAYRRIAGMREALEVGGASEWEKEKWLWNRLWKVPVWLRVKLFFWQLCSEALTTSANIAAQVQGECSFCPLCTICFESSIHLFRDCTFSNRVWEGTGLVEDECDGGGSLRDWVESRWREFGCIEHALFMMGCWALWEHRNKVIFYSKEVDPAGVIGRAMNVMEETEGGGFI
ncbi:uncharacterized protein LOC141627817 [Silene latifolia]|uniref:uncharacterized protein LOC141627817 n=1 Tax=Silene latifolia TaxID=37657 RepID=UPI003D7883A6